MNLRKAQPGDESAILELIKGLAEYENEPDAVINTSKKLHDDLFKHKYCEAFVVEIDSKIIGFSLFYTSYSTWKGPCIYLEDLYILPEARKTGAGSLLFDAVVNTAKDRKVNRMDWQVLDWNEPAIKFYEKKNAILDPEWINGRLFFEY
ncbi:MAG: GNAT family N-acetyltransferase [Crocinitomicaceae bacterium]|nr:GNAT family N-acetyltransferase [Crocinitomicaceae bacterium]